MWKGKLLRFESVRGGYGQEPGCPTCGLGKRARRAACVYSACTAHATVHADADVRFAGDPTMEKSSYYRFRDVGFPLAVTASFAS